MSRNIYLSLFIVFGLLVSSCSSDDGDSNSIEREVVGTWEMVEFDFNYQEDGVVVFDQSFSADGCNSPIVFTFSPEGVLTNTNFELDLDEDFNNNVVLVCDVFGSDVTGTWEFISGNSYELVIDGESGLVDINFSDNNNTIEIVISFTDFDEIDDITYTETVTLRGSRT